MPGRYVPEAGDIVTLNFDPQAGHEQAGFRPALILSAKGFNRIGVAMLCPITTKPRGLPFEVALLASGKTVGVVLCQHLKSHDWIARNAKFVEKAPAEVMEAVRERVAVILGLGGA